MIHEKITKVHVGMPVGPGQVVVSGITSNDVSDDEIKRCLQKKLNWFRERVELVQSPVLIELCVFF